jgi:hypothetical protein
MYEPFEPGSTVNNSGSDVHVYPLKDLREHVTDGSGCPCAPRVEVVGSNLLYVHNAWDNREVIEQIREDLGLNART